MRSIMDSWASEWKCRAEGNPEEQPFAITMACAEILLWKMGANFHDICCQVNTWNPSQPVLMCNKAMGNEVHSPNDFVAVHN